MHRVHVLALGLLTAVTAVWLAIMALTLHAAALPDRAGGAMLVLFAPTWSAEDSFRAIVASGGNPVRPVLSFVWVAQSDEPGLAGELRAHGARLVTAEFAFGPVLAGCVAYADARLPALRPDRRGPMRAS